MGAIYLSELRRFALWEHFRAARKTARISLDEADLGRIVAPACVRVQAATRAFVRQRQKDMKWSVCACVLCLR